MAFKGPLNQDTFIVKVPLGSPHGFASVNIVKALFSISGCSGQFRWSFQSSILMKLDLLGN